MSKPIYRHITVPIEMDEAYETRTIRRQTGTRTVQKTKGLLNPERVTKEEPVYEFVEEQIPTGRLSDTYPNTHKAGKAVEDACNGLAEDGYDVISITPILRGIHAHEYNAGAMKKGTGMSGFGYGYGYSLTDSLLIIGKLKKDV